MHLILRVPSNLRKKADEVLSDDVISRQSIALREAESLGAPGAGTLIIIEGSEGALRRAEQLFQGIGEKLEGPEAARVYELYRRESDDMASGLGLVFGS